jgi:hypothetical protein
MSFSNKKTSEVCYHNFFDNIALNDLKRIRKREKREERKRKKIGG